jgi:hypothetical protein
LVLFFLSFVGFFFLFDGLIVFLLHHEKLETTAIVTRTALLQPFEKTRKRTPKENTYAADKSILTKSTKNQMFSSTFLGWGETQEKTTEAASAGSQSYCSNDIYIDPISGILCFFVWQRRHHRRRVYLFVCVR